MGSGELCKILHPVTESFRAANTHQKLSQKPPRWSTKNSTPHPSSVIRFVAIILMVSETETSSAAACGGLAYAFWFDWKTASPLELGKTHKKVELDSDDSNKFRT